MEKCCICENELNDGQPISILTHRGVERINRSNDEIHAEIGKGVHQKCSKDFTRPRKSDPVQYQEAKVNLRSATPTYNAKGHCIFLWTRS